MTSSVMDPSAQWITHPDWVAPRPAMTRCPLLRRRFDVTSDTDRVVLTLTGLGVWDATLDGEPLGDVALEPGMSDVTRRVATFTLDLARRLDAGPHELVVELGEGPAHVRPAAGRYTKFVDSRVAPRLLADLRLDLAHGGAAHVVSDDRWEAALGRTTLSHWYGGEDYDATLPVTEWTAATVLVGFRETGPAPWVRQAPPVRVVDRFVPRRRTPVGPAAVVVDFGTNHAGRPVLTVGADVPAGTRIELWPSEDLLGSGHVDQTSTGAPIFDSFTGDGTPSTWRPRFTYHGYRYVEMRVPDGSGWVLDRAQLVSEQVRSDNPQVGSFSSSDESLNQIYELTDRAVQSNLFGVLTDCPHREKLGWLEQMHLVFPTLSHYFDVRPQLADVVQHMLDAQTPDGLVPDIAPELTRFSGGFRDDVNWGSAIVRIPWHLWRTYGDLAPARVAWPAILRYLDYVDGRLVDGLLPHGLGDWKTLDTSTPATLVHGHGYLAMLAAAGDLADALGTEVPSMPQQVESMRRLLTLENVRADGRVGSGSQASYALALDAGLVPHPLRAAALGHLLEVVRADGHRVAVGEVSLPPLLRVLAGAGCDADLMALVLQRGAPGYMNMLESGCTALAETWEVVRGEASANHFMLGGVVTWFVENLAGLRQSPDSIGWRRAVIAPSGLDLLSSAEASFESPAGRYSVAWRRTLTGDHADVELEVPEGGGASLVTPDGWRCSSASDLLPGSHHLTLVRDRPNGRDPR